MASAEVCWAAWLTLAAKSDAHSAFFSSRSAMTALGKGRVGSSRDDQRSLLAERGGPR
jgi:hypothetical protein